MSLAGKRVAIVGGYGKMGLCLARLFLGRGLRVTICGRREDAAAKAAKRVGADFAPMEEAIRSADLCVLSVPMDVTYELGMQASRFLKKGAILLDISSVKSGIFERLERDLPDSIRYVSTHPLFGPTARSLKHRNVVLIKGGDESAASELARFLEGCGVKTLFLTAEQHDRMMASLQALHHFVLLSLSEKLERQVGSLSKVSGAIPESLKLTLRSLRRTLSNLETVMEIRDRNPYARAAIADYIENIEASGDRRKEAAGRGI